MAKGIDHSKWNYRKGYLDNCICATCVHRRVAIGLDWLIKKKLHTLLKDPYTHDEVIAYVHQFYYGGWSYFVKDKCKT